jgi:hypothetical protein
MVRSLAVMAAHHTHCAHAPIDRQPSRWPYGEPWALPANLDAWHGGGGFLRFRFEEFRQRIEAAERHSAEKPRDKQKPEEAWHVAKLLLSRYMVAYLGAIMTRIRL